MEEDDDWSRLEEEVNKCPGILPDTDFRIGPDGGEVEDPIIGPGSSPGYTCPKDLLTACERCNNPPSYSKYLSNCVGPGECLYPTKAPTKD